MDADAKHPEGRGVKNYQNLAVFYGWPLTDIQTSQQ